MVLSHLYLVDNDLIKYAVTRVQNKIRLPVYQSCLIFIKCDINSAIRAACSAVVYVINFFKLPEVWRIDITLATHK